MTVEERFRSGELIFVWTLGDLRAWWCDAERTPIALKAVEAIIERGVGLQLGETPNGYYVGGPVLRSPDELRAWMEAEYIRLLPEPFGDKE